MENQEFKKEPNVSQEVAPPTAEKPADLELSPEEIERFEKILHECAALSAFDFQEMGTWESFKWDWDNKTFEYKKEALKTRKLWFQMKQGGKSFENFFEGKIRESLNNLTSDDYGLSTYKQLVIYTELDYKNSVEFFSEILNHKRVWASGDGSNMHQILRFFRASQDPEAKDAIIRYIEHALSEDYKRKDLLSSDLGDAVSALKGVLGQSAKGVLEELAEKDKTFAGWFEKKKLGFLSTKSLVSPEKKKFDEFDEVVEAARIEMLKAEYEELRKNPPPAKKKLHSSLEPWTGGLGSDATGTDREDEEDEPSYVPFPTTSHFPPLPPLEKEKKESFDSRDLYQEARKWQSHTFLNFYGRFRPKAEKAVSLGQENYLNSLLAASSGISSISPEAYLNFLSGAVNEQDVKKELPEKLSVEEAYKVAVLSFSRALCTGILDNKKDEAVSEINAIKDFLGFKAEAMTDPKEVTFMVSLSRQLSLVQGMLLERGEGPKHNLPKSANAFLLYHSSLKKAREVPDFQELLREKIRWFLANDLFHNMEGTAIKEVGKGEDSMLAPVRGASFRNIQEVVNQYSESIHQYKSVENTDVPLYWEAGEKLEDFDSNRVVVFGRDGKYFFTALKTSQFGKKEKKELKYVIVTTPMGEGGYYSDTQKLVAKYLKQNGVTLDFTFIDTGFRGTVPEFAIKYLAKSEGVQLSSAEIDKKIKLLSSAHETRSELSRKKRMEQQSSAISIIEDRPKVIERPETLVMDEKGRVRPHMVPNSVSQQLLAWTVEHAVLRNFAPRLDAEKRIKYLKQNPLEGHTFIQEYHGSHIGTHPMQLWENQIGKKVLVKGGPSHTLKADLVGQRFLKFFGLPVPNTELISTDEGKKLKIDFFENWKTGGITLPSEHHKNAKIQSALLVDALIGNYDRTSWNLMFPDKKNELGQDVLFIDNGASLTSRARGGHKGFPEHFTVEELKEILSNPQFPGRPVNEAYHNFIEVKNGKIIVKNRPLLSRLLENFLEVVPRRTIDAIIEQAEFPDGERSKKILEERISRLAKELELYPDNSEDYRKTAEAIETYKAAIAAGGEATYLKRALMQRWNDIINLFSHIEE